MNDERREEPLGDRPEETGMRGGSAAFAATRTDDILFAWAKTVVRWSPIWVGFLVALGINLVLYVLSLAVALSTAEPTGTAATDIVQTATIWTAISSFIALFVGGFLAGRLGVHQGLRNGVTQGTVVWALFVIGMMLFSVFGLGGLASNLAGMANVQAGAAGAALTPQESARLVGGAAESMWWLFAGLVISWLSAALGGYLGVLSARPETAEGAH